MRSWVFTAHQIVPRLPTAIPSIPLSAGSSAMISIGGVPWGPSDVARRVQAGEGYAS
jgi:hypothetical protein